MLGGDKNAEAIMHLEKLLELFSSLPDKEEPAPEEKGGVAVVVEAEPKKEI